MSTTVQVVLLVFEMVTQINNASVALKGTPQQTVDERCPVSMFTFCCICTKANLTAK